ncbi:hypothetical protein EB796_008436 [Bugula neritina]|uniref:Reverse transcriptase domain-containing protein n=1 Tax=Bugula neritina TaxID=10212 RepID=A0A7J7K4W2_BUGNE|nr:hypothetical protein EB796_008436 [Bugula neritina]
MNAATIWKTPGETGGSNFIGCTRTEKRKFTRRHRRELLTPIEIEVVRALAVKSKGAPGPDGYTWKRLKNNTKAEELASFFNLWLLCGRLPTMICEGRTTLVPKVVGTKDPSEFRPVTVCSVFTRLFHSILGSRLERLLPISQRQKGFRKGDGIFLNSLTLQRCIADAKANRKNLRVAFIDLRKAFDSVGHDALWTSCRKLGVPEHFIKYCHNFYRNSSTRIVLDEKLSQPIRSRRGIKQGDPMSVHLFNAVVDYCTDKLRKDIGFTFGDEKLQFLAFADDLVNLSEDCAGLRVNCNLVAEQFSLAGLKANPAKCATLNIKVLRGTWVCDDRPFLEIAGTKVTVLSVVDTYKYLGVQIGSMNLGTNPTKSLESAVKKLSKAPLKPQQRLFLLRTFVIPKFTMHSFCHLQQVKC